MPKSKKLRLKNSKPVKSKQKKQLKSKIAKIRKSSKSKYLNDPIGHRKSLHGKSFTDCYDKFNKLKHDSKSGHPTLEAHKKAVKYLKEHLPKCIDIIGNYLLDD
jgi:hypothetical protein